jgi:hypothetical protein
VAAAARGLRSCWQGTDESEVTELGLAVGTDEDVGGFEVAVQEIAGVQVVYG